MDGSISDSSGLQPEDSTVSFVLSDLPALIQLLQGTDVRELELREGDLQIRLHRSPVLETGDEAVVDAELPSDAPEERFPLEISAPLVGVFHRSAKAGLPPLVSEGTRVENESVVGVIEALHVLTEVEAHCTGTVIRILVADGQAVQYGQSLFEVESDG